VIHRHGLALKRVTATYINPYSKDNILLMSLAIHGAKGSAAWEETDLDDFLQELVTVKYFPGQEAIETTFVDSKLISGNLGNVVKTMIHFIHQVLVQADPYLYSFSNIEEGICRHPELTVQLTQAFEKKFHPGKTDLKAYKEIRDKLLELVDQIDTGQEANDTRRKNILKQGMNFIDHVLKTNVYRDNILLDFISVLEIWPAAVLEPFIRKKASSLLLTETLFFQNATTSPTLNRKKIKTFLKEAPKE
jgi:glutamate dehydrogenase